MQPPTPKPLWRMFLTFLWPMMLSNVLQALSGTLNNIFLGHMIGVKALASASVVFPVVFFCIATVMGLASGATVLIGQAFGARDEERLKSVAAVAVGATAITGVAMALGGLILAPAMMRVLGAPTDIYADAVAYTRAIAFAMPALVVFLLYTAMLRGVGDTRTPLWALAVSTLVGLVVTPLLIKGWLGLPPLGPASAAWASAVSSVAGMSWLGWTLHRRGHVLAPNKAFLAHMRMDPAILKLVLIIGVPAALQMVAMSLAEIVLLGLVNSFGSDATAAYGAVNQVMAYVQFPALSIAITASILGAQAIGAGHAERLRPIVRTAMMMNLIITGGGVLLCYIFAEPIVRAFISRGEVVELTQTLLHIVLWSCVVMGMGSILSAIMRASGEVWVPTLISIAIILVVEAPTGWILSHRFGVTGVWWAWPAAFTMILLAQTAYYKLVWSKKTITRLI
ncbi:MATE family efflux transporter [Caulobacter segnis]|uniref:MATE family efflux transporter n=1 Tax=Caulobacter segnis TaxID=88688 RepID=UPI00240EA699|nr:MATE family efflux transporter [Caulobacter segnis]MDG2520220.1 MATE family efflux transporter [Caulobacter segnis]